MELTENLIPIVTVLESTRMFNNHCTLRLKIEIIATRVPVLKTVYTTIYLSTHVDATESC
jgi:hypothetical protein